MLGKSVYGLPEIYRDQIRGAQLVACPGCYPTSILIPLRPLIRRKAINRKSIVVASMSGVTGAGRKAEVDYLFSECNESVRPYGVPKHRHLSEIEQELSLLAGEKVVIQFTPHLVPINRGIVSTIYADIAPNVVKMDPTVIFNSAYGDEPFVRLLGRRTFARHARTSPARTSSISPGKSILAPNRIVVMSAIDNVVKGAERPGGSMYEFDARPAGNRRIDLKKSFRKVSGSICAPLGFKCAAVFCDIKKLGTGKGSEKGRKDDLALIVSDVPAAVAGMFTTNQVCAAPVKLAGNIARESLRAPSW